MEINPKIGLFAIALTAIPVGTIAATAENPSAVTVLPPSPSENVSLRHIIEGRIAIATPPKPI